MSQTIACDVSEFQTPVNNFYPHRWLIFRICDGGYRDQHFAANYVWARNAAKQGKIAGYTCYVVYRPGVDTFATAVDMLGQIDKHLTVLVDVESWGGGIFGDHSAGITKLAEQFATLLGDRRRVLAYGNTGDLNNLYPHRPAWLRAIVASYGAVQPATVPNIIGWQYSDGQDKWPVPVGLPRSSPPFGRCDHNVFPGLSPKALAAALGVGAAPAPPDPMEEFMALDRTSDDYKHMIADIAKAVGDLPITAKDGTRTTLAQAVAQAAVHSRDADHQTDDTPGGKQ